MSPGDVGIASAPHRSRRIYCLRRTSAVNRLLLAFLEAAGEVRTVAGYRLLESLSAKKFLYVDDLVTRAANASKGYSGAVFNWLIERAHEASCG